LFVFCYFIGYISLIATHLLHGISGFKE